MINKLSNVLTRGFPNRTWSCSSEEYSTLVFHDDETPLSEDEINAMDATLAAQDLAVKYRHERAANYPSIAGQLDALWHAMDAGVLAMVDDFYLPIKMVKNKFPKEHK